MQDFSLKTYKSSIDMDTYVYTYANYKHTLKGLLWWLGGKQSTCQCRRHRFDPWPEKIPNAVEQLSPCVITIEPVHWGLEATTTESKCYNC